MQSPTTQIQSHQQPKSTCSQLKSAFVGFQQTPKRQGQQTMGRLLPACSAFTNPPSSLSYCQQLNIYQSRGNNRYRYGWASRLAAFAPWHPNARRIPANSETARTTNDGAFASSLLSVHEPPELLWATHEIQRSINSQQEKSIHVKNPLTHLRLTTGNCEAIAIAIN